MTSTFEMCVKRLRAKDGSVRIRCALGLWCVSGKNKAAVEAEARRYWMQYFKDGEYADHLKKRGAA